MRNKHEGFVRLRTLHQTATSQAATAFNRTKHEIGLSSLSLLSATNEEVMLDYVDKRGAVEVLGRLVSSFQDAQDAEDAQKAQHKPYKAVRYDPVLIAALEQKGWCVVPVGGKTVQSDGHTSFVWVTFHGVGTNAVLCRDQGEADDDF